METVRGRRRREERRNKKKIHSEGGRKDKIQFQMASPQKYMPQCTSVCKCMLLFSVAHMPVCNSLLSDTVKSPLAM